jgi:putative FmdB family regulatory protein
MPTYQYVCGECNAPLEVVQSFSDDALTTCPECKAEALKKVYGSVGVVFKGSGFYRNDSRGTTSSVTPSSSDSAPSAAPAATPAPAAAPASTPSPSA